MSFTPVLFTKGTQSAIAESIGSYNQLVWDGWTPDGPPPPPPRDKTIAHLSDIDALDAAAAAKYAARPHRYP